VLSEAENKVMHSSKLAIEIYEHRLYLQKNGNKAQYEQIRTWCGHYPDMFEALPGNYIKLKEV
jgi:antitoxin Phd